MKRTKKLFHSNLGLANYKEITMESTQEV